MIKIRFYDIAKLGMIALVAFSLFSCVPQKKILYLQDYSKSDTLKSDFASKKEFIYKVQPGDNLYIRVFSLDEKTVSFFNSDQGTGNYYLNNDISVYLNSYSVNDSGYVEFPLIGNLYVKDMTVERIKNKIQEIVDEYLKETTIVVKLVSFTITIIGEVKMPGTYRVWQDDITIFEAISLAGDLTDFAKRNQVILVRQKENGTKRYMIDLNDQNILMSDLYYLQPNDLIYVEPLKSKQFTFENFPYAVIFAGITTALLMLNYIK